MEQQENKHSAGMEMSRVILYTGVGALGLLALALGIIQKDWELVALGAAIASATGVATWNVPAINNSIKGRGKYAE